MSRKWRERRVQASGAQQKKVERKGPSNELEWGSSEHNRHDQIAAAVAARREEEMPKVEVLQSRLTRAAAAASLRRRALRAETPARRVADAAVDRPIRLYVWYYDVL